MGQSKSFNISKQVVWRAFELVKSNQGSYGVDEQSIEDFEKDLKKNLYKIWNRMSSGTYLPKPVRAVEILKNDGKTRVLGIPTVGDRVAQTVAKLYLEPLVDSQFHEDSYGYRPKKSAHDAVRTCRQRCWDFDWVVDLDIKGFFDNLDHDLVLRAVRKHTDCKWILLYVSRWLKAPMQMKDGSVIDRPKGTPQGGVISPLLANLFLHHAFDLWITERFPNLKFERYADDIVVHCRTRQESHYVRHCIRERLQSCRLELNAEKTKVVYCLDSRREKTKFYQLNSTRETSFDFLGFTFRRRTVKTSTGNLRDGYTPAISRDALKEIQSTIRSWHVGKMSDKDLEDLSKIFNPILRGWFQYYGAFGIGSLKPINHQFNHIIMKWAMRKYKSLWRKSAKTYVWLQKVSKANPKMFATWYHFHGGKR